MIAKFDIDTDVLAGVIFTVAELAIDAKLDARRVVETFSGGTGRIEDVADPDDRKMCEDRLGLERRAFGALAWLNTVARQGL